MKTLFSFLLLSFSTVAFSQNSSEKVTDSLKRERLFPCKKDVYIINSVLIDSINKAEFEILLNKIYMRMKDHADLTISEDKEVIKIMNTFEWSLFDNQSLIVKQFDVIEKMRELFKDKYVKELSRKYRTCIGSGFSTYYIPLQIQYVGNPGRNERYYIK